MAHVLKLEDEAEKKRVNRQQARKEFKQARKEVLLKKLVQVAKDEGIPIPKGVDAEGAIATAQTRDEAGKGDVDVKMTPAGSKVKGVIRKIGKIKARDRMQAPQISKAIFLAAKRRGAILNIKVAKETLYGKKKVANKPNVKGRAKERARDRRLRKYREKRERKMGLKPVAEGSDSEGNSA